VADYVSFNGSTQAIKMLCRTGIWFPALAGISATFKFRFTNTSQRGMLWTERANDTEYYLDINNSAPNAGKLKWGAFDSTDGFDIFSDGSLADGEWHYVTVVKAATNNHYWRIDGAAPAQQPGSVDVLARAYSDARYFGAYSNNTIRYTGDMGWAAFHNKALSAAEIDVIHADGSPFDVTGATCDYYPLGPAGASSWGADHLGRQLTEYGSAIGTSYSSSVLPTAVAVDGKAAHLNRARFPNIRTLMRTARVIANGAASASDERIREIGNGYIAADGDYVITYTGSTAAALNGVQVHYATSPDGVTWTKQGVMLPQATHGFYTEDAYVYRDPSTGTYWLMCENRNTTQVNTQHGIAVFSSTNGKTGWTLHSSNVLAVGGAGTFDSQDVSSPTFWKEGDVWYLVYEGRQGTPGGTTDNGKIGLATASTPAGPWTKSPSNPVFSSSGSGDWRDASVVPDDIQKVGDSYYLIIHANGTVSAVTGYRCGMIQSSNLTSWSEVSGLAPFTSTMFTTLMRMNTAFHHLMGVAESGSFQHSILRLEALGTARAGGGSARSLLFGI
jgi:hypothetical protein